MGNTLYAHLVHVVVDVDLVGGDDDESLAHEAGRLVPQPGVLGARRHQHLEVLGAQLHEVHEVVERAARRLQGEGIISI